MSDESSNPGISLASIDRKLDKLDERAVVTQTDVAVLKERLTACRSRSDEYHAVVERRLSGLAKGQATAASASRALTISDLKKWLPLILGLLAILGGGGAAAFVRALAGGDTQQVLEAIKAEGKKQRAKPVVTPVPVPVPVPVQKEEE